MVEVTRSNFEKLMPDIEHTISDASFIAVDAEFTGLNLGTTDILSLFDSMDERYRKLSIRARSFAISQIGLSAFTKHPSKNSYQVKTYIFFIRPYLCGSIDKRFMCQASCLDFLCRYDFDFNKFIKEGIPFINECEEKQLHQEIEDGSIIYRYKLLESEQDTLISDEFLHLKQHNLQGREGGDASNSDGSNKRIEFPKDDLYPEYFQLTEIRNKYPSLWAFVDGDKIVIEEVSAERKEELQLASNEEKQKVMNFFLGFTRVFRMMKNAQKPIVGHNFLMDLLLCFQNFHQPLPDNYRSFKKELHSLFPIVYDTRHIWRHVRKYCNLKKIPKQCGLFELYEMFKSPPDALSTLYFPSIELSNGKKYADGEFRHDSGYDSYITGWVFLNICHVLAMKKVKSPVFIEPQTLKQHLNAVAPFVNKINLAKFKYNFINLNGDDPPPSVPDFLHVSGKAKQYLNETELSRVFNKYGMMDIMLMSNKKQAVISVGSLGSFRDILRDFKDHKELTVSRYNVFKHSPVVNTSLWLVAIGSACAVAFLVTKLATG